MKKEIVDFVKAQNPKVESVQIDWNSMQIEESGNGNASGWWITIYLFLVRLIN